MKRRPVPQKQTKPVSRKTARKRPAALQPRGPIDEQPVVKNVCIRYNLKQNDLTRLTSYSPRAIAGWVAGKEPAAPARKQLRELVRLFDALADLMEAKNIGPWLNVPNPAFAHSTPLQVIERGEHDRIWRMIYQLETGQPV